MLDRLDETICGLILFVFVVFTVLVLPSMLGSYLIDNPQHLEQEQ